jgi:hypothetical protein
MFADLDESIRQLFIQRGNLDSGEVDISFDMPSREWASRLSRPTVSVYLFDVRENVELRSPLPWNVRPGPNNTAIKSRPEVRVDVTYRITAFANAVEDEHRLLARVLLTLFQHPQFPAELLQGSLAGQEIRTEAARPDGLIQSPADYWSVMDNDLRPSIDYRLTLSLDLTQEVTVGIALTRKTRMGQMNNGNGIVSAEELPYQIGGKVHRRDDSNAGVPGAKLTLVERALDAITDADGRYFFKGVPAGAYTLVIAAPGAKERRQRLEVPNGSYDVGI